MTGAAGPVVRGAKRARWTRWLPWIGTVVLGLFVTLRTDLSGIGGAILGASPSWLACAIALYGLDRLIAAVKWRLLFTSDGSTPMSLPRAFSIYLRAGFIGSALPSTVGMDAVRIHLARREGGSLTHSMGSVLIERWLGVMGLIVVAGVGLVVFGPRERWLGIGTVLLAVGGITLLAVLIVLAPRVRVVEGRGMWFKRALRFGRDLQTSLRAYSGRPGVLLAAFSIALGQHYLLTVINWILALALGLALPLTLFLWLWPLILIAVRLPVSVLGFGIREAMLYGYFVSSGLPPAQAVTLGLLSGGLDLLFIAIGGLLMLRAGKLHSSGGTGAASPSGSGAR